VKKKTKPNTDVLHVYTNTRIRFPILCSTLTRPNARTSPSWMSAISGSAQSTLILCNRHATPSQHSVRTVDDSSAAVRPLLCWVDLLDLVPEQTKQSTDFKKFKITAYNTQCSEKVPYNVYIFLAKFSLNYPSTQWHWNNSPLLHYVNTLPCET